MLFPAEDEHTLHNRLLAIFEKLMEAHPSMKGVHEAFLRDTDPRTHISARHGTTNVTNYLTPLDLNCFVE